MEGGCLCGQVRYVLKGEPLDVVTCHCRNCQKQSGSALSLVVVVHRHALDLAGELKSFEDRAESGQPVWRRFCPECGSPVLTDTPTAVEQGIIFVKGGTLDRPETLSQPTTHYWTERRHEWITLPSEDRMLSRQ